MAAGVQNQLPTVELTSPANGTQYQPGERVTLTADATDRDGTISKVSFYARSSGQKILLGEKTAEPYSLEWITTAGRYQLEAVATDNDHGTATSGSVLVTVGDITEPPPNDNCRSDDLYQTPGVIAILV